MNDLSRIPKYGVPDYRSPEQRAMDEAMQPVLDRVLPAINERLDEAITNQQGELMSGTTVGDLSGNHIGAVVTIRDGGATYTGSLRFVHHDKAMFASTPQKVFLGIDNGDWKHTGHYPTDTPIDVEPSE